MARSFICGFEMGHVGECFSVGAGVSIQNTVSHGGGYAMKCTGLGSARFRHRNASGTFGTPFKSMRFYLRIDSFGTSTTDIVRLASSDFASNVYSLSLTTAGAFRVITLAGTLVSSTDTITADGMWHRVEWDVGGTGFASKLYVDGALWITDSVNTAPATQGGLDIGGISASGGVFYIDDILCDDTAFNGVLPGEGYAVLLKPAFDTGVYNSWTAGGGGTTGLSAAVDNVPPIGSATASNTNEIKNAVSGTTLDVLLCTETLASKGATKNGIVCYADATTNSGGPGIGSVSGQTYTAVDFKFDGALATLSLLSRGKTGSPTDNVVVEIRTDNAGVPSATILATQSVAATTWPVTGTWVDFTFATPVSLTNGIRYWIVVHRSGAVDGTNFCNMGAGANTATRLYADASAPVNSSNGTTWAATQQLSFKAVRSATSGPADTINAAIAVVNHAEGIATGTKSGNVWVYSLGAASTSNNFDYGDDVGAGGTFPTNWATIESNSVIPTDNNCGSYVVALRKATATTRETWADFLGVYVDYTPAPLLPYVMHNNPLPHWGQIELVGY